MIRSSTDEDITDEEFEKVLKPFIDNYDDFSERLFVYLFIYNFISSLNHPGIIPFSIHDKIFS